jgi:membrane-associated HD superfamily phosphohydrolase
MATNETKTSVQREAPVDEANEVLERHVESVEAQTRAISNALTRSRQTRLGIFLGFLLLVCAISYSFYKLGENFRSEENLNKMGELAQRHLDDNTDRYVGEVKMLVDNSLPVLKNAFMEQAKQDTPKYTAAIETQRDELLASLPKELENQITQHYQDILKRHERILKEEFPDLTDEQLVRVAANLEKATKRLVEKYYVDRMSGELEALYQTWDRFPPADPPGPNDPELGQQMIGCMMELMIVKATETEVTSILETN